ncbi:hypothetical protein A4R26_29725 [Niastella populi]|uniref:Uncharacterized protein n=1 Tax=Niastella populi TaxID=550983 RepID=A0A1V9EYM1_9BACT|nr:hypothetical protein A4R26_29725 [Niastella populi]
MVERQAPRYEGKLKVNTAVSFKLQAESKYSCKLQASSCKPQAARCKPQAARCKLQANTGFRKLKPKGVKNLLRLFADKVRRNSINNHHTS